MLIINLRLNPQHTLDDADDVLKGSNYTVYSDGPVVHVEQTLAIGWRTCNDMIIQLRDELSDLGLFVDRVKVEFLE